MKYVIAYDIGTTGVKTCIFKLTDKIEFVGGKSAAYPLYVLDNGGAEQDPNDWWNGMCDSTREVLASTGIKPEQIEALSFCSQAQGVVLVDKEGKPVRRAMSYMDQRATEEVKKGISYGLQIAGANIFKLIPSLVITGAVTSSAKDPVWKYKWVEAHEPEVFKKIYKWLDVKDYLICRCTKEFTMTDDTAFGTLIYDNRPGKGGVFSKKMCKMFNINMEHLPRIIRSTDVAGLLCEESAKELGLMPGTKVFGGGGDSSLIGIGAGATKVGDTHVYVGTSGWVITVTDKRMVDTSAMIAAITGADPGKFNYFAEMETAGKCYEWVHDHLALDEINMYMAQYGDKFPGFEGEKRTMYDFLNETIKDVKPGSNGVIFTPWLHGNRCPFEDPHALGMFFGLKIETGKRDMIRSVLEGIYYHLRWMLECENKKLDIKDTIRFCGGGALSPIASQILCDVLGKKLEVVDHPQNVGSMGAAAVMGIGLGLIKSFDEVKDYIPVKATFTPNMENHKLYEPYYQTFRSLHDSNKKQFKMIEGAK